MTTQKDKPAKFSLGGCLAGKKMAQKSLGDVLVLGLGKTGLAAAKYCAGFLTAGKSSPDAEGAQVAKDAQPAKNAESAKATQPARVRSLTVYGGGTPKDKDVLDAVRSLEGAGVRVIFDTEDVAGEYDLCIASPGISQFSDFYASTQSHAREVISEIEFAWRESAANSIWVAITGTNGKTTTTSLTAHILKSAGLNTYCVGNIGSVALEAVARDNAQHAESDSDCVCEVGAREAHDNVDGDAFGADEREVSEVETCDNARGGMRTNLQTPSIFVAEVSSYQLASTKYFAPDVAVLLNITPDHLHWHKTMQEYEKAKLRLFDNLGTRGGVIGGECGVESSEKTATTGGSTEIQRSVAILDATNDTVRKTVRAFKAIPEEERGFSYIPIGTAAGYSESMRDRCGAKNAAYLETQSGGEQKGESATCAKDSKGEGAPQDNKASLPSAAQPQPQPQPQPQSQTLKILFNDEFHTFANSEDLQIKGPHNYANALAAAASALSIAQNTTSASIKSALTDSAITIALKTFMPLEHRIEPCGSIGGVECYNDSKATNVDATLVALDSFPAQKLVVLLGGLDKDTPLDALVEKAHTQAHHVVCFGQAGARFSKAFKDAGYEHMLAQANNLENALDTALTLAHKGDVILLSPACASFDEFNSFEHRGEQFKEYVNVRTRHPENFLPALK